MSAPPQEPTSHAPLPPIPHSATQTVLPFLGQAASREAEAPAEASAAVPTVLGPTQNVLSQLSPSIPHATPTPQQAVSVVFPQHVAERPYQGPAFASTSSQSGATDWGFPTTQPDKTHQPRPRARHCGGFLRWMIGPNTDKETVSQHPKNKDPHSPKCVSERLDPTFVTANKEYHKATRQATVTGWAQNIALGLQIFIGALTTALGAALTGKKTSISVSVLGGAATLVASFLARTKSSNEPQTSQFRAQALDHFRREMEAFTLDHGHETNDKWDDRIHSFRLGLEKILGNHNGPMTAQTNANIGPNKLTGVGEDVRGSSGIEKYPMTSKPGASLV